MNVSVVVTVLNEEKSIARLIRALSNQTKKPDEILIIDGGSEDKTVVRLENSIIRLGSGQEIKILVCKGNRSMGRNYGIAKTRNSVIAITDAGGYPKKDWLEKITKPFINPRVWVVSGYYFSLARTPFEKAVAPYFLVMPDKISSNMEFLPSSRSVAFRKSVWKKVGGYPEKYSHNEDLVFDYTIKKAGYTFHFVPEAIVMWNPPENLVKAARQFFRFALGDAESSVYRQKVKFIFMRYGFGFVLLNLGAILWPFILPMICAMIFGYAVWSVWKNVHYVDSLPSLLWLPIIQVCSDLAVMSGYIAGRVSRLSRVSRAYD